LSLEYCILLSKSLAMRDQMFTFDPGLMKLGETQVAKPEMQKRDLTNPG